MSRLKRREPAEGVNLAGSLVAQSSQSAPNHSPTSTPVQIDADAVIAALCRRFPQAFDLDPWSRCPLKVGIRKDLDRALAGAIPRDELTAGLAAYVNATGYLAALVAGEPRIDLAGNDVDLVSEGQAKVAADILASRRKRGLLVDRESAAP